MREASEERPLYSRQEVRSLMARAVVRVRDAERDASHDGERFGSGQAQAILDGVLQEHDAASGRA